MPTLHIPPDLDMHYRIDDFTDPWTKPETILFSVAADGSYYWNDQKIADADLVPRLTAEAGKQPQPELHIRGDKDVRYERVAQAMSAAREAGVRKIGFITEPNPK